MQVYAQWGKHTAEALRVYDDLIARAPDGAGPTLRSVHISRTLRRTQTLRLYAALSCLLAQRPMGGFSVFAGRLWPKIVGTAKHVPLQARIAGRER